MEPLLERLGVSAVYERPLNGDARLVLRDGRLAIEVNPLFPKTRRRLSVAHELAHLILNRCAGRDQLYDGHSDPLSERLCDRIAGELLAPEWALRRFFDSAPSLAAWQDPVRCSTLLSAARAFAISIDAMACRVVRDLDFASGKTAILWRFSRNSDCAISDPALRVSSAWQPKATKRFIPLNKTAPKDSVVATAFVEEGTFVCDEELSVGGLKGTFHVEAVGFGGKLTQSGSPSSRGVLSLVAA